MIQALLTIDDIPSTGHSAFPTETRGRKTRTHYRSACLKKGLAK